VIDEIREVSLEKFGFFTAQPHLSHALSNKPST
jgi:hypothetical protein